MSIIRSLVGYAPAVVLPRIVSLVLMLLLTRLISKQEYGLVVLVVTVGEAIDGALSNWTRIALARFASVKPDDLGRETARSVVVYALTLAVAIPVAIVVAWWTQPERWGAFAVAIVAYILAIGALRIPSTVMSVQADRHGIVTMEATKALGVLVIGVAATLVSDSFLTQSLILAAVTTAVGAWGIRRAMLGIDLRSGPLATTGEYLSYGLPVIPAQLVFSILTSSDRLFLDQTVGSEAVALYAAGVMLARQPMDFLFSLAGVRVFPLLMEDFERSGPAGAGRRLGELTSGVVFITLPAAAGILLVADPMTRLLLAPDYQATAAMVIPPAVGAALLIGYKSFVLDQVFHMIKRNGLGAMTSLPAALVGLAAMAVLVPRYGVWGCALGFLVQNMVLMTIAFVVTRRFVPFALPWGDIARTVVATAIMAGVLAALGRVLPAMPAAVELGVSVFVGVATYVAACLVLRPSPVEDLLPARFRRDRA